jgi:hypothetical protein
LIVRTAAVQSLGEAPALLVTRNLETLARILVLAARSPRRGPPLAARATLGERPLLVRRLPQLAAGKPLHLDVGVFGGELLEGRLQLLGRVGPERCRFALENDRPVDVARWHVNLASGGF